MEKTNEQQKSDKNSTDTGFINTSSTTIENETNNEEESEETEETNKMKGIFYSAFNQPSHSLTEAKFDRNVKTKGRKKKHKRKCTTPLFSEIKKNKLDTAVPSTSCILLTPKLPLITDPVDNLYTINVSMPHQPTIFKPI